MAGERRVDLDSGDAEDLRLLPQGFVDAYRELWFRANRPTDGARRYDQPGGGGGRGRLGSGSGTLGDEEAQRIKTSVDRELRGLARRIVRGQVSPAERCGGCGTWASGDWRHCASCGRRLAVDEGGG